MPAEAATNPDVIQVRGVYTRFGDKVVHDGVNLDVRRGEIFAIVGGSGSGKSTLLRELVYLQQPDAGSLNVLARNCRRPVDSRCRLCASAGA